MKATYLLLCLFGFHNYEWVYQSTGDLVPVFEPRMGIRELMEGTKVCQRCGWEHNWFLSRWKRGKWISYLDK